MPDLLGAVHHGTTSTRFTVVILWRDIRVDRIAAPASDS
jgi:hypothetical protein